MQTTEATINQMNTFDPVPAQQIPVMQHEVLEKKGRLEPVGEQVEVLPIELESLIEHISSMVCGTQVLEEPMTKVEDEPPALVPQEPDDLDDEAEDDDIDEEEEDDVAQVRHSMRIAGGVQKPDRYSMVTKLKKEKEMDKKRK
jgi:hypothetical protein